MQLARSGASSRAFDVTLATYESFPDGAPDDQALAAALRRQGARTRFAIWNDADVDWEASAVTVIRSTWDYFHRVTEFHAWLDVVEEATDLLNQPATVRWNMDKIYLRDLAQRGIRTVPTRFVDRGSSETLRSICASNGWSDVVVKPTISGGAFGAARFAGPAIDAAGEAHLRALCATSGVMVQPYLSAIEDARERALVFIDGRYSHAIRKAPFNPGVAGGQSEELPHEASAEEQDFGHAAIEAAGDDPAYARVDIVPTDDGPALMELELIEPNLFLAARTDAADQLAAALLRRLARREAEASIG